MAVVDMMRESKSDSRSQTCRYDAQARYIGGRKREIGDLKIVDFDFGALEERRGEERVGGRRLIGKGAGRCWRADTVERDEVAQVRTRDSVKNRDAGLGWAHACVLLFQTDETDRLCIMAYPILVAAGVLTSPNCFISSTVQYNSNQ